MAITGLITGCTKEGEDQTPSGREHEKTVTETAAVSPNERPDTGIRLGTEITELEAGFSAVNFIGDYWFDGFLEQGEGTMSCFLSAFVIAITNPATVLSFMVVFSMFRIGGTESVEDNIQLVFGIFCGTCVWWSAVAVVISLFRSRITADFHFKLNRILGAFMILFGIVIGIRGCLLS